MKYYTVSQVATLFDVSHSTVLNWIAKGKLEKEQVVPRGKIRIPELSIPAMYRFVSVVKRKSKHDIKENESIK